MSTVSDAPATQQLLIGGQWRDADGGRTHDVIGAGERPVTRQAAASAADARAAADAAAAALPEWSSTAPEERRDLLARAGELLAGRAEQIAATMAQETGGTFGWGMFNVAPVGRHPARGRRAGDAAGRRRGRHQRPRHEIDRGAQSARRLRRDRALERAGDPRHARGRVAARLRQHGRDEGERAVAADPRRDRPGAARRGPAGRRRQPRHQRPGRRRRGRRRADRAPGGAPRQLHRLHARRPADRAEGGRRAEALAAGAGRQGAAGRARRRRRRAGGRGGLLRRLHERRPDLHVDRARGRRQRRRRRLHAARSPRAPTRSTTGPADDPEIAGRPGRQRRRARARARADRRRRRARRRGRRRRLPRRPRSTARR